MAPMKTSMPRLIRQDSKGLSKTPGVGLVLMDTSLRLIAIDWGASAILKSKNKAEGAHPFLPKEILDMIGGRELHDLSSTKLTLHIGTADYTCRTYYMEANNRFPAMIALHLERIPSATDAVSAVSAKYNLTERERETLWGISMGLSSKELADRMNISPNTVKVFLRLIMIKMGVASRGAIIAQILQNQSSQEDDDNKSLSAKM